MGNNNSGGVQIHAKTPPGIEAVEIAVFTRQSENTFTFNRFIDVDRKQGKISNGEPIVVYVAYYYEIRTIEGELAKKVASLVLGGIEVDHAFLLTEGVYQIQLINPSTYKSAARVIAWRIIDGLIGPGFVINQVVTL